MLPLNAEVRRLGKELSIDHTGVGHATVWWRCYSTSCFKMFPFCMGEASAYR